jgi:ABC-2 type transport system ATP-binding protein
MSHAAESAAVPATPAQPALAICTRGLRKVFGDKVAVRNLNLEVPRGEVFGFLGPNGAGKSTSLKMLLGLVTPTRGQALVLGQPAGDVETRRKIGFLPEHFRFYDWLSASELLRLHGQLYGMSNSALRKKVPEMLDLAGLGNHAGRRLRDFSKGMLQRIGLAQALLNQPQLIFLDEPTSGLDPAGRRLVRDIIKAERERGATVLLNSHLLGEVEATCDRVAFIKHGEVLETRELGSLLRDNTTVEMRVSRLSANALRGLERWASAIVRQPQRLPLPATDPSAEQRLTLTLHASAPLPDILRYLVSEGVDVYEFTPQRLSLEERFLQIVGNEGEV